MCCEVGLVCPMRTGHASSLVFVVTRLAREACIALGAHCGYVFAKLCTDVGVVEREEVLNHIEVVDERGARTASRHGR